MLTFADAELSNCIGSDLGEDTGGANLELHDHELDVLGAIATGLEIDEAEAQARFDEIQAHVEAVVADARAT